MNDIHKQLKPQPKLSAVGTTCPLRLLIVEDNLMNLRVLNQILNRMGFQPDIARDGAEAVEAVRRQSYDMIFMDLQMPVMDGFSATRAIHSLLGSRAPWIVAFTANAQQPVQIACKECGMNDFISKPATPRIIEAAIRKAFQSLTDSPD